MAKAQKTDKPAARPASRRSAAANPYRDIDFRKHPEKYRVGRGEQGVLTAEPYKSEMLPHWRFANPAAARRSAAKLFSMYLAYKRRGDFVGMDLARKFIQMGYTRSRRYATHAGGRKYDAGGAERRLATEDAAKAESAAIFRARWEKIRADPAYQRMKAAHRSA